MDKILCSLKRVCSEISSCLSVAIVFVRSLAVIVYTVNTLSQFKSDSEARKIHRNNIAALHADSYSAVRSYLIISPYAGEILCPPSDGKTDI